MNAHFPFWLQQILIWSYVIPAGWMMAFAINLYILIFFSVRRRRQMGRSTIQMINKFFGW